MAYGSRLCEVCFEPYRPTYGAQRTCGRRCGALLNWAGQREAEIVWPATPVPWRTCTQCGAPYIDANWRRTPRCKRCPLIVVPASDDRVITCCKDCGEDFQHRRGTRPRTRCDACTRAEDRAQRKRNKLRRRQGYQAEDAESIRPAEIFQRDNFTCLLCGQPLEMDEAVPHPRAPTLDHIAPLAHGGRHTRANVRSAHFLCNSIRQTKDVQPALPLGQPTP